MAWRWARSPASRPIFSFGVSRIRRRDCADERKTPHRAFGPPRGRSGSPPQRGRAVIRSAIPNSGGQPLLSLLVAVQPQLDQQSVRAMGLTVQPQLGDESVHDAEATHAWCNRTSP